MLKRRILIIILLITFLLAVGMLIYSSSNSMTGEDDKNRIIVAVSIPPQAEFAEKVGGDRVKVVTMVPAGANPHTYEALPEQLKEVSNARMYVQVGSGLEFEMNWMDKLKEINKNMLNVNSSQGIDLMPNQDRDEEENQYDAHVWTSPRNAKIMVENTYQGLIQVDPENKEYYKANKERYLQELDVEDKKINMTLSGVKNKNILVYHPAWGYLCRDYGMNQISIEKNGKEPTPQGMVSLINQARENNITVIFISPQFSKKSAESVAQDIGGEVVMVDDMDKNYIDNLNRVSEAFKNAMS